MIVEIDCPSVESYGEQMVNFTDDFKTEMTKFGTIIESINTIWDGADALKYVNSMMDNYLPMLNEVQQLFEAYAEFLQKVPEPYQTLDESYAARSISV